MYPVLLKIGPFTIHTYGFMIAMGFLGTVAIVRRLATRDKLPVERVIDLVFWTLLVGFVGSRILFVITRWETFSHDLVGMFRVWEGGLVFLGAPIASTPFVAWYARRHKLPIWRTMDAMIPGLPFAHALGRLGCLAAGCCYGRPTDLPWGIRLSSELVDPPFQNIPLHPTQLYESVSMFILTAGLIWLFKRRRFEGQIFLTYMTAYPVIRSVIEIFRGDVIRGFIIEDVLSTSQFLSILVFLAAVTALVLRARAASKLEEAHG